MVVEGVRVTIELESYLPKTNDEVIYVPIQSVEEQAVASIRANQQSLTGKIGKLVECIEQMENKVNQGGRGRESQLPREWSDHRQKIVVTSVDNQDIMQWIVPKKQRISCQ